MDEAQQAATEAQNKAEIAKKRVHSNTTSTTNATVVPSNSTVEVPKKNATLMAIRARTHAVTVPF